MKLNRKSFSKDSKRPKFGKRNTYNEQESPGRISSDREDSLQFFQHNFKENNMQINEEISNVIDITGYHPEEYEYTEKIKFEVKDIKGTKTLDLRERNSL
jgi:hypothetical protein